MRRLALLALVFTACHGSPTEPHLGIGSLSGRVVFAENGSPVSGARVVAHFVPIAHGRSTESQTLTDLSGRYSIENLIGGQYVVSAYAPSSNETSAVRLIDLGPTQNILDLQISANRCAWITGTVRDSNTRHPIGGATVTLGNIVATTASDGTYTLALGCPPVDDNMNHPFSVQHPAYQTRQFPTRVPTYSTRWDVLLDPR
jgi:carboxypeptidase family protein